MPDFSDRFSRLELPQGQVDWSFLDPPAPDPRGLGSGGDLPRPLPTEDRSVWVAAQGRVYVPASSSENVTDGDRLLLYDLSRRLEPLPAPATFEVAWHQERAATLLEAGRRFRARVPLAVLEDPGHLQSALSQLAPRETEIPDRDKALVAAGPAHTDESSWLAVVGHARLLRLQHKLYNLVTLHEYAAIFSKALGGRVVSELARLPPTAGPAEFLARIEASLDDIHPKARSPLRNKMDTSRVVLSGITLLPIYVGSVTGLYERYAAAWWGRVASEALRAMQP